MNKENKNKLETIVSGISSMLIKEDIQFVEKSKYDELKFKLEEKDKIIDEIEKRCNQEINAATIQYERHKKSDIWQYIIAHKRILEILERGKNGK